MTKELQALEAITMRAMCANLNHRYTFASEILADLEAFSKNPNMILPMDHVLLPAEECEGRILASASVNCPPAVPIAVCGERIEKETVACLDYYGISACYVVEENDRIR